MTESTLWWIIAGFFVSLELLTGSFYLLMLALGAGAAAISASFGAPQSTQLVLAAVVGGGSVYLWHRRLLQRGMLGLEDYTTTGLGSLDVGEHVNVSQWRPDGTTQVHYRGSEWMARYHGAHVPSSGQHRIRAIESNYLVLERL
ncbi:MAG: NfeD family protein [Burkholderiales bacterium]|nr:NfeD family protein [Burkholderiales bacterium]MBH2016448.1 NfeD family protein [Burkholderiales bacterium]